MDIFDRPDLETLLRTQAQPCVSIFMPTERAGREVQQNPIRLKNLVREAEELLHELGVRSVDSITKPAHDLLSDGSFWRHQGDGLVLFLAPDYPDNLRKGLGSSTQLSASVFGSLCSSFWWLPTMSI